MKIIFWGKGNRGVSCLKALCDHNYNIDLVVGHPSKGASWYASVAQVAKERGIEVIEPENPNDAYVEKLLADRQPDLFILAGYGKIVRQNIIDIPKLMCINLHGGKMPAYRGSSPLNWALINGETSFGLSVLKVDAGVDTGDILIEREFSISGDDTIKELHKIADEQFPLMLLEAVAQLQRGTCVLKSQDKYQGSYYPMRFPEDGLILWEHYTAEQVHNRIRALTEPYPCAFTYFRGRMVKLLSSELYDYDYFGEPGRVYMKTKRGLLVCAADKCLWITAAKFTDGQDDVFESIQRYDQLLTAKELVLTSQNFWSQQ